MKQEILTVISNKKLNNTTYEMVLGGVTEEMEPGQFVEIKVPPKFLRRPFSIADFEEGRLTVLYKVVGGGTELMTKMQEGEKLDVLTGLGNLFDMSKTKKPLLIGGGIGIAPMLGLAKAFSRKGIRPMVILGFRSQSEFCCLAEFESVADVIIATDDGSYGIKGNALDALKTLGDVDYYYACGPMVMLKAIAAYSKRGELSLEARMGCGFGACMGCSIKTTGGFKRVCKEGPVFSAEEIIYE